jgi:large subunit ribosomal protein L24
LNASGRIDTTSSSPRGSVALDIDARDLSGMAALISTFLPQAAPQIRRLADRLAPAKLRATLDVEPAPAGNGRSLARLNLGGGVGAMRIILAASATGEAARPGALDLKLDTKIESDDGGNVLALLGLGRMLAAEKRPQQFTLAVTGPLNGDLRVDGRLAGELDAVANGTIRFDPAAAGTLNLTVAKADLRRLRQAVAGKAPDPLPLTLRSQVALAGNKLTLNELSGSLGGSPLKGQLSIAFAATPNVEGRLEGDAIDVAAFVAAGIGMPMQPAASAPGQSPPWSAEPFQGGLYPEFSGRIDFKTARAAIGAGLITKDMKGRLRFAPAEIGLEDIEGELAGGRLAGQMTFRKSNDGITARGRVALTRADASLVIPGGPRSAINGRVALQAEVEGTGLSPKALIGSLGGTGVLTLENAQIAGLDPKAFPAVIRAVDQGLAVDATRVRDFITTALDAGRLAVAQIDTAITITGGQARIGTVVARGEGADVAISGTYELADSLIDGRVMLSAPRGSNASAGRPEVGIMLKGPLAAPKRTLDVAALSGWLALRSVEQQSKRVEEAERLAAEHARREAERVRLREEAERLAAIKAQEEAVRLRREEVERMQAAPLSPSVPFRVSPATAEPAARGSTEPAPTSPSAMQAPLLPPAIDIRPAAGSELAPTIPAPRPRVAPRPPAGLQPSSSNRAPLDLGLVGSQ